MSSTNIFVLNKVVGREGPITRYPVCSVVFLHSRTRSTTCTNLLYKYLCLVKPKFLSSLFYINEVLKCVSIKLFVTRLGSISPLQFTLNNAHVNISIAKRL